MTATKTTPTAIHVAGYIRLTRDESLANGLSAPAQTKGINDYAKHAKLEPLRIYAETESTAGDDPWDKRRAGSKMIEAIKRGEVKHIITRDLDRLTRDMYLSLELANLIRKHGVTIHTFSGPVPMKSASDMFAYQVRSAASEFEKNQTGDRVRKAKAEAVRQGRWSGGPPPFGYQSQARHKLELITSGTKRDEAEQIAVMKYPLRGKIYLDDDEATILRLIYELSLLREWGSRRICNHINKLGYRTRAKCFWSTERLSRTLMNPSAAGYFYLREDGEQKLVPGNHEAIVTLDEWRKVQEHRTGRTDKVKHRGSSEKSQSVFPFSGVIRCSCGSLMKVKHGRYICAKAKYFGRGETAVNGCTELVTSLSVPIVHSVVWPKLRELVASPDLAERVHQRVAQILKQTVGKSNDPTKAIAKLNSQIAIWYERHDGATADAPREAAWCRIVELTEQKKLLQSSANKQAGQPVTRSQIENYLASMVKLLDQHGGAEATAFVKSLVDHQGLKIHLIQGDDPSLCSLSIRMGIRAGGSSREVEANAPLRGLVALAPRGRADQWVIENSGNHRCKLCGKAVEILKRHFWLGVPKHHAKCWSKSLITARLIPIREAGLVTATELAHKLKIGRSSINRWVATGKLPEPERMNGAMCFARSAIRNLGKSK